MPTTVYRFTFSSAIPLSDVQETLVLSLLAVEALHGSAQLRPDAVYRVDLAGHACEIAADTEAGKDFNKMFVNFARREFGPESFRVERVEAKQPVTTEGCP